MGENAAQAANPNKIVTKKSKEVHHGRKNGSLQM